MVKLGVYVKSQKPIKLIPTNPNRPNWFDFEFKNA